LCGSAAPVAQRWPGQQAGGSRHGGKIIGH
jgi:hypothetical protein